MATIRTTLALYDGVTGPLKAMCRGMNALINTMDSVKDTFGDSFDPTVLQQIREDLAEATVGFDQMEQNIRQADKAQSKFNNTIQEGSSAAGGMLSQIKKIAVSVHNCLNGRHIEKALVFKRSAVILDASYG